MSAFGLWSILLVPFALFFTYRAWRNSKPLLPLLRTTQSPVRKLRNTTGSVKVAGTTVPADESGTVTAPISGTECLAYRYEIKQRETQANDFDNDQPPGMEPLQTVYSGSDGVPFLLDDGTGQVVVDPSDAEFQFGTDNEFEKWFPPDKSLPGDLSRRLESIDSIDAMGEQFNIWATDLRQHREQRMTERRLDVDESATVVGQCSRETGDVWGVDARIAESDGQPFLISDGDSQNSIRQIARPVLLNLGGVVAVILFLIFVFLRA